MEEQDWQIIKTLYEQKKNNKNGKSFVYVSADIDCPD